MRVHPPPTPPIKGGEKRGAALKGKKGQEGRNVAAVKVVKRRIVLVNEKKGIHRRERKERREMIFRERRKKGRGREKVRDMRERERTYGAGERLKGLA
jgi:hypothetical protein